MSNLWHLLQIAPIESPPNLRLVSVVLDDFLGTWFLYDSNMIHFKPRFPDSKRLITRSIISKASTNEREVCSSMEWKSKHDTPRIMNVKRRPASLLQIIIVILLETSCKWKTDTTSCLLKHDTFLKNEHIKGKYVDTLGRRAIGSCTRYVYKLASTKCEYIIGI